MSSTDLKYMARLGLGHLALVQPGYLSRTRVEPAIAGTHKLLQSRDVSADGTIDLAAALTFDPERNPSLYRVSKGDILILARGQSHHAHLVQIDLGDTLASSVFHIIRPDHDTILPGYLAWWLNQPDIQAAIMSGSRGTGIGYVSRQHMEQISVMLPPRHVQQRITDTLDLWQHRQSLQSQLDQKRQRLIQTLCRQAVRQDKEPS